MLTVGSTAVAQSAAPSAATSSAVRAGAETEDASEMRGGYLIPLAIVVAIILGIILLTGGDDDSNSP